jgi:hypothetical protein
MCKTNLYIDALRKFLGHSAPLVVAAAAVGCDAPATSANAPDAGASPNASILPAPLAMDPQDLFDSGLPSEEAARVSPSDSASRPPPTESLQPLAPLPADPTPYANTASGVSLEAAFRWRDVPPPPRAPEVSADAHRDAQRATTLTLRIDLSDQGRMRAELTGSAFLLPAHTELRARFDHYGHLLVWPGASGYRVVAPGTLRPLLGERRMDVTPLSIAAPRAQGDARRLGYPVRKVELASSVATVRLELGRVPEAGDGGALLCRALVELGGVDPRSPACQKDEVPLAASYAWQEGGGISFEVSVVSKRADLPSSSFLVPPPSAVPVASGLPAVANGIFLSREHLAALRSAPITLPAARDPAVPGEGFVAANHSERTMILSLDGIPTVWVAPFGEQYVIGPLRGRYLVQWRSFLGEKVGAPQLVEVPARLVNGGAVVDAGAPDGG